MPREFALADPQCRWNYNDEADVAGVDAGTNVIPIRSLARPVFRRPSLSPNNTGFDEHDIPYDVLWLDIEHTDSKKYFTWDPVKFPNPTEMINKLAAKHRKVRSFITRAISPPHWPA